MKFKFFKTGLFILIISIIISGSSLHPTPAHALALCSELSDPVVHIFLDGVEYTGNNTITTTPGHVFSFSWAADHDIDDTTNGSYYAGHSTGGYHIVSGSGTTDAMPASGSV